MSKPITPDSFPELKTAQIPDDVFDVFNQLIIEKWNGSYASVYQSDVVDALCKTYKMRRAEIYDRHWLDVEDSYRAVGWEVKYNKPAYNETFPATFTFRKKFE